MANSEINEITFDNTAANFDYSPNNIAESDELKVSENFDYERPTHFADLKRKLKIAKIAVFSVTLTVTGGALVVNVVQSNILPKTPAIESPSFKVENKILYYSFNLTNVKNYKVTFSIKQDNTNIYNIVLEKEGKYENSYDLSNYSGSVNASIDYTNGADLSGNLYTSNFTL